MRLNFYMDVVGGGSSTEALVGIAIGIMEAGMCKTVAIFRSMNGYSPGADRGHRGALGCAGGRRHAQPRRRLAERQASFAPTFALRHARVRHKPEQVANGQVAHDHHASNNPKAYYKKRFTVTMT